MAATMVLVNRELLFEELRTVFDTQIANTLLNVLDKVAAQVVANGVSREDFSELKRIVAALAEEQRKLAEEQRKLTEAQRRTEERLCRVEVAIQNLTAQVSSMVTSQKTMSDRLGSLQGRMLEITYREKAPAYFGRFLRRPKVVDINSLWDALETHLSADELDDVLLLDLIVKGKPRRQPEAGELYLAVEVSAVIDATDVTRAARRAKLLQRAGYQVVPVVAGEVLSAQAEEDARSQQIVVLQDGRQSLWEEALSTWLHS